MSTYTTVEAIRSSTRGWQFNCGSWITEIKGKGEIIMRSLSSMMAEFARGKDKKQRKKRTLLGSIGKGALVGLAIPVGVSALGKGLGGSLLKAKSIPQRIANTYVNTLSGGAMGGYFAPATALAGGATAAGAYGINKLRNKDKKPTMRSRLNNLIPGR